MSHVFHRMFRLGRVAVPALALFLLVSPVFAGGGQEPAEERGGDTASPAPSGNNDDLDPDTHIAGVNGVGIQRSALDDAFGRVLNQYAATGRALGAGDQLALRTQLIDQLIAEELLYQKGVAEGLEPDAEAIESEMARIRSQFPEDEAWQNALEANNTTEAELRSDIVRNQLVQNVLATFVQDDGPVSDAEVRSFYDENPALFEQGQQITASHILISTQGMTEDADIQDARARAEAVRQELLGGADFAETARQVSEGPSGPNGGSLGTFGRGQMVPPFEEAAFALEPGEISEVVQTQFGFHIIRVSNKTESSIVPLADVRAQVEQFLNQQRQAQAVDAYVDSLREAADVVVFDGQG